MTVPSERTDNYVGDDEIPERPHRAYTFEFANEPGKSKFGGSKEALSEDARLYPEQGV